jgi:AbrB family looped-hinge helix DNA binding protein
MARVTGKFQLTLPKALAEAAGIRVGDELDVERVGTRLELKVRSAGDVSPEAARLAHFDRASARRRKRGFARAGFTAGRGWTREELYRRGRAR